MRWMVYCLWERAENGGSFHASSVTEPAEETLLGVFHRSTDLLGEHDRGLLVAEFHSLLSASLRSHPCTRILLIRRLHRHRLGPSVCTPCHCHLTTDNWCHSVKKYQHVSQEVAVACNTRHLLKKQKWRSICGDSSLIDKNFGWYWKDFLENCVAIHVDLWQYYYFLYCIFCTFTNIISNIEFLYLIYNVY